MDPAHIGQLAGVAVATTAAFAGIGMVVHFYVHRIVNRAPKQVAAPRDDERLARLELAVESIAVEVERITEGQRFLTRLQTGAPEAPRRSPSNERREITPVS